MKAVPRDDRTVNICYGLAIAMSQIVTIIAFFVFTHLRTSPAPLQV
ncbi:hypothetical protein [Nostoc sp.]